MAGYTRQEVARLDMEAGNDYDISSGEETQRRFWKPRYTVAAVIGAAALAGCGAMVSLKTAAEQEVKREEKKLTARMLFESDVIHKAAADNVLKSHAKLKDAEKSEQEVREIVAKTFKNIIEQMKTVDPATWHALENAEMTQEQHDTVAHVMKSLKDPRVMQIGLETGKALREAGSDKRNAQAKAVYDKLMPRSAEISALYDEIMPKKMQEVFKFKGGEGFKSILKPENAKVLKTVGGTYYDDFTKPEKTIMDRRLQVTAAAPQYAAPVAAAPATANPAVHYGIPQPPAGPSYQYTGESAPMKKALEALGIIGTVTAEADTMIRIINPVCKEFNHDLAINPMITTGIGAADFMFQIADCELDAVADHMNPVEAMGCPAMASSAGFDAAREMFTLTGVLGDNNPKNGAQGNHEGDATKHEGVFNDSPEGKGMEHAFPFCTMFGKCD